MEGSSVSRCPQRSAGAGFQCTLEAGHAGAHRIEKPAIRVSDSCQARCCQGVVYIENGDDPKSFAMMTAAPELRELAGWLLAQADAMDTPFVANELRTHSRKCPKHGVLGRGATHPDCPVTYENVVCACECTTCKRAWWAAGRPKTGPVSP